MSVEYRIRRKTGSDLLASHATNLYDLTVGDTVTVEFRFPEPGALQDLTVGAGETYTIPSGTSEVYDMVTVEDTGTLVIESTASLYSNQVDNDGTIDNDGLLSIGTAVLGADAWVELQQHADYAGSYQPIEALDSTLNYKQFVPNTADVDSLVVGIEPSSALQNDDVTGVWALVDAGTDTRNVTLSDYTYQVRLTVLADLDDYADHSALETDLEY